MVEATNHHTAVGPLRQVDAGLLNVGYAEAGPGDGRAAMLLHGWAVLTQHEALAVTTRALVMIGDAVFDLPQR